MPSRRYELKCEERASDTMRQRLIRQKIRSVTLSQKPPDSDKSQSIYSELTVVKSPRAPMYEVQYIKTKKDGIKEVPVLRQQTKNSLGKDGRGKVNNPKKTEEATSEVDESGSVTGSVTGSVASENSDAKTDEMVGLRVIACNRKDGLYYPGSVASHLESTYAVVNFNFNKRQKVRTHMIIPMSGAIPRPELAPGDFVLVKVFKQHVSLDCYVPAIIEFVPEDFRAHTKFYSVLMYNGQRASTMRKFIVKIGRSRFEVAVNYIAHIQTVERERQRALTDITPRSQDTHTSKTSDRSDRSDGGLSDHSSVRSSDRSSAMSGSERGRKKKQRLTQKLVQKQTDRSQTKSRHEEKSKKHSRSSSRSTSRSKSRSRSNSRSKSRSRSRSKSRSPSRSRSRSKSSSRSRSRSGSDTSYSRSSVSTNASSKKGDRPHSRAKRRESKPDSRKRSTSRSNSSSRSRSRSTSERKNSRSTKSSKQPSHKRKDKLQSRSRRRSNSRSNTSRSRSYSSSRAHSRSRSRSKSELSDKTDKSWRKSRSKTQGRRRSSSGSSTVKSRSRTPSNNSQDRTPRASPIERPTNPVPKPRPSLKSPEPVYQSPSRHASSRKSDHLSQSQNSSIAVQLDEKDQVIGDLQHQLNKQLSKQLRQERRLIRQARKINKIQRKLKHSDNNDSLASDKTDKSRSVRSSSDTDGSPRRRKESPDGTSYRDSPDVMSMRRSAQGLEFDKEVLARWSDDGWYYRGRVLKMNASRYIIMDTMGHLEDIPHEDILTEERHRFEAVQPQDCVIALHPKYVFSYAPGEVLHVFDNGNVKVEFYDGNLSKVAPDEVYKIPREKFKADMEYIVDKEKALLGKSVVAREDHTGAYRLGVVDSRVGIGQQYYLKWLDGDMCKQSSNHIFEVSLKKTNSVSLEHVLAPIDSGCIHYKPAVVLQREPLLLQYCDGFSNTEARREQCFWITKDYYTNAVEFLLSKQGG